MNFVLLSILLRSFLIQAHFTFQEKLGTGFGFMLYPGFKKIAPSKIELQKLLARHTEYFNCHPYMAGYIAGAVLKLEELAITENGDNLQQIDMIKNRLGGVLGSLGDRLFWKYLKPGASIASLTIIFLLWDYYPLNIMFGIGLFILLYNSLHLFTRIHGLYSGYNLGENVIRDSSFKASEKISYFFLCFTIGGFGTLVVLEANFVFKESAIGLMVFLVSLVFAFYSSLRKVAPGFSIISGLTISVIIYYISTLI